MKDAFNESTILRWFFRGIWIGVSDEAAILNFGRLLEKGELASGILQIPPIVRDQECQYR